MISALLNQLVHAANRKIKVLSVDIFDTLLFRTVSLPQEVFEVMHDDHSELFPKHFNNKEWSVLRTLAEKTARENREKTHGTSEVTLKDIYAQLPLTILPRKDEILLAEIQTEQEVCYLNDDIVQVITHCKNELGCKIVLTSDMYLSKAETESLLVGNELDMSLVDDIFMSCEHGISKRRFGLYNLVLQKFNIRPNEMLHIGDNIASDVQAARKLGIHAYHYDLISNRASLYPFLEIETLMHDHPVLPELMSLRLHAAAKANNYHEEAKRWHTMGAMIAGPFFAGAAEWVLDTAEQKQISALYPLMREGAFLSKLLHQAAKHRNKEFTIIPLNVSRKALYLPSLARSEITEKQITYVLNTFGIRVRDVFSILGLDEYSKQFADYLDVDARITKRIILGNKSLFSTLIDYFLEPRIQSVISQQADRAHNLLIRYLQQAGLDQCGITLDLGCRGTMQACLDSVFRTAQSPVKHLHLLLIGTHSAAEPILNGTDIQGYLGSCGRNSAHTGQLFIRLLELFMMCETGTTLGYALNDDHKVTPILAEFTYPNPKQLKEIEWIQKGVLDFQKTFLQLGARKQRILGIKTNPAELIKPLTRLMSACMKDEAKHLGEWCYDQNFGAQQNWKVVDQERLSRFANTDFHTFLADPEGREMEWYPGLRVLADPFVFIKKMLAERNATQKLKLVLYAEKILSKYQTDESVIIAGGGITGEYLHRILLLGHPDFRVEAFTDRNQAMHGQTICNIPIKSLADTFTSNTYVVGSLDYEMEIVQQIRQTKGSSVRIISYS